MPSPKYNFNEKQVEYSAKDGKEIPVVVTPKYTETKKKVIDILESGIYKGLNESYFWILMNRTKSGKMAYTGLIISHDGMKLINDNLPEEKKVQSNGFSEPQLSTYENCLYMTYRDKDTYEIGEISKTNCMNSYPYAMLYKRTYDRVVRDKAKLYGIYSESEADEFKEPITEKEEKEVNIYDAIIQLYSKQEIEKILKHYGVETVGELEFSVVLKYFNDRKGNL